MTHGRSGAGTVFSPVREGDDIRRLYGTVRSALGLAAIVVAVALGVAAVHRVVVVPPAPIEVAADTRAAVGSGAFHKIEGQRVRGLTGAASKTTDPRVDPSDPSESGAVVPDGSEGPDAPVPGSSDSSAATTAPGGRDDDSSRGGNPASRVGEAPAATPVPAPTAPGTTRPTLPTIPPVTAPRLTVPTVPRPSLPGPTVTLPTVTLPTLPGPQPTLPGTTVPVSTPTITIPPIIITIPGL